LEAACGRRVVRAVRPQAPPPQPNDPLLVSSRP
jgi:hypothetical protein